jgi:hypothetical protein
MKNIQEEVQKIHNQYGVTEMANYKIQLLCEQYANDYHEQQVKNLSLSAVSVNEVAVCDTCTAYPFDKRGETPLCKTCEDNPKQTER